MLRDDAMNSQESVEAFIRLVRANPHVANVSGGCDDRLIALAEAQLSLRLPPSYRKFLQEFGGCDIAGEEFYGIWVRGDDESVLFGAVRSILNARRTRLMPPSMVAFMADGMGGLYVMDT